MTLIKQKKEKLDLNFLGLSGILYVYINQLNFMHFEPCQLYHIYNRGNNKQNIFFKRENYIYFLNKARQKLIDFDILAYCLMPNHFHFLLYSKPELNNEHAVKNLAVILSSYTKGINRQENRIGSLFQQKTKSKELIKDAMNDDYPFICFNYIHQNPMNAGLVSKMEDWEFSSFRDYANLRNGTLCNKMKAEELLGINLKNFYDESYGVIADDKIKKFLHWQG